MVSNGKSSHFQKPSEALSCGPGGREALFRLDDALATAGLVREYERLPALLASLHLIVLACPMLHHWMVFSRP